MRFARGERDRPVLWVELALGLAVFGVYVLVTGRVGAGQEAAAVGRARAVYALEQRLKLDLEPALNDALYPHPLLVRLANYEYATTYVLSAFVLLFWLLARRPARYRPARNSFVLLNLVAMACFALWPVAPPRLVPEQGFVDTVQLGRTWGSWGSPVGDHANQWAAMPSLHFAWAVWVSVVLARLASGWRVQLVSAVHVLVTFVVIVATGNHYVLDAAAGFALAAGCVLVAGRPAPPGEPVLAADAFFLHVETPGAPQVVGGVVRMSGPPAVPALAAVLADRLDRLPRFRQRLARRSAWHRWRWVDAGEPDWAWHVVHARDLGLAGLPLDVLAGRLVALPLPTDRPLWRMVASESGVVLVVHHVVADGVGLVAATLSLLEPRLPDRSLLAPVAAGTTPRRVWRVLAGLGGLAADTVRGRRRLRLPTGGGREFASVELPLAAVRAAARRHRAGVPELLLSLLATALGGLVARPGLLRVAMPLTTRAAGAPAAGNRTGTILVDLPVAPGARPEPAELTARATRLAASGRPAAARSVLRLLGVLPVPLHRLVARAVYGHGTFGAIVSCMPGPRARLSLAGPAVQAVYPLVPPAPGTAVAVGTLTWNGRLCVGIEVDPALAPAATLAAALGNELAALTGGPEPAAAQGRLSAGGPRPARG